jgi:hypothetical protein
VRLYAPCWAGRTVVVHTDSSVAKGIVNKGRSKNKYINDLLRAMCWQAITHNIAIRAVHVPGTLNAIPDSVSRLHEPGNISKLWQLLSFWHHGRPPFTHLAAHMSHASYCWFHSQVRLWHWRKNSPQKWPLIAQQLSRTTPSELI